jgi:hypothetical protein
MSIKSIVTFIGLSLMVSLSTLYVYDKYYVKQRYIALYDISTLQADMLIESLSNSVYRKEITLEEFEHSIRKMRERVNQKPGIILEQRAVIKGFGKDITPEFEDIIRK